LKDEIVEWLIKQGFTKTEAKRYVKAYKLEQQLPKSKKRAYKFLSRD